MCMTMWTNEFEFDRTIITLLDDEGKQEDVEIEMTDEFVDIRQFNDDLGRYDLITLSPKMMLELLEAFKHPAGAFTSELHDLRR